jgi:hypothetical protein
MRGMCSKEKTRSITHKKTDARANAQRLSRSAAVACFRCLLARSSHPNAGSFIHSLLRKKGRLTSPRPPASPLSGGKQAGPTGGHIPPLRKQHSSPPEAKDSRVKAENTSIVV